MISFTVLIGFAAAALLGFTQFNRYAASARLRAQALTLAQQRTEQIMTTSWRAAGTRPAVLAAGTATENNLAINTDATNSQAGLSSTYTSTNGEVRATRTTVVTDLTARSLRAVVTVTFTYANRTYTVAINTLRVTDSI